MQTGRITEARQYAARGQLRHARRAYKQALAVSPRNTDILTEFGVLEAQNGAWKSAHRLLEKACRLAPDDFDIRFNLAEVLREREEPLEALPHYRKAAELAPQDADALYGLGDALRVAGEIEEAIDYLDRAHQLNPNDAEFLNALAIALENDGQIGRAMQCYHRAIVLTPDSVESRCNYGEVLFNEGFYLQAAQAFEGAQNRSSDELPVRILMDWAVALSYSGDYDVALDVAERAIATGDAKVESLFIKGVIFMQQGQFERATEIFHQTLDLDENVGEAYERLARLRRLGPEATEKLASMLHNETLGSSTRAAAGFALYNVLDKAGESDAAFDALARANQIKAVDTPFDAARHEELISKTIATFDKAFFATHAGEGYATDTPIFVLGMPRSGTTLTEQILAAYPQVKAGGERQDFQHLSATLPGYPEGLETLSCDWARDQGERILQSMTGDDPSQRYATNKSPGNYAFIGLILWIFPRARVIYCRRDPREIGLSCYEQNFRSGLSYAYNLEHFAFAYKQHQRIMEHWLDVAPFDIHIVDYERMVSEPEVIARGMVEYCELEWDPQCLDTSKVTRPIETASVWQVRQPINTGSLGKWKRYERQLQPMIEALGLA